MPMDDVAILIPAYKPDMRMNAFIRELQKRGFSRIIVVDDGGGSPYASIFQETQSLGCLVLTHEVNRGKGAALKTGLAALIKSGPISVITADCDGQHSPGDVFRMAEVMRESPGSLILGSRDKTLMPPRSRAGNTITCAALGLLTGLWISDTQTGLRGLPKESLDDFLTLDGDRYEYEMNMLIKARQLSMPVVEMVIDTIYIDDNRGSHFNTLKDSARIYALLFKQIGKYIGSSLASGIVEYIAFFLLHWAFPLETQLVIPVVGARAISSIINYFVNREMVFKSRAGKKSLLYFYLLVAAVLFVNYWMIYGLTTLGVPTFIAKPLTDAILFVVSYNVQQRFVFRDRI